LRYLDERPIFPVERKASAAWQEGGLEALQKAKRDHFQDCSAACRTPWTPSGGSSSRSSGSWPSLASSARRESA
ncbi:unnamed protein product, partial [Effrenium voratum]